MLRGCDGGRVGGFSAKALHNIRCRRGKTIQCTEIKISSRTEKGVLCLQFIVITSTIFLFVCKFVGADLYTFISKSESFEAVRQRQIITISLYRWAVVASLSSKI